MDSDLLNITSVLRAIRVYGWWQVALELLLIGAFVYAVLRFLRGTRGVRVLKGIGFAVVVLYIIVRLVGAELKLERIDFLYGKLLLLASLAAVVVFQPELRRAFMQLGETRFFSGASSRGNEDIEAVVEAAAFLSRRKIGALIAFERDVGLAALGETGTRLDAEVSAAMLETIFWPNSPLHDLGVIIANGRLMAASVQFPLAESDELAPELGSRHRAAVGVSQEYDAVVVVVSEETGDISVADRGRLMRRIAPDALKDLLMELLGRAGPKAARLRKAG